MRAEERRTRVDEWLEQLRQIASEESDDAFLRQLELLIRQPPIGTSELPGNHLKRPRRSPLTI